MFGSDVSDVGVGGCLKVVNKKGGFVVGYCSKNFDSGKTGTLLRKRPMP